MAETLKEQFTRLMAKGAFDALRRHLSPIDADDRLAEAVGMVWALALRKAVAGIRLDDALVVHAVKLRAQDCAAPPSGRSASAGRTDPVQCWLHTSDPDFPSVCSRIAWPAPGLSPRKDMDCP